MLTIDRYQRKRPHTFVWDSTNCALEFVPFGPNHKNISISVYEWLTSMLNYFKNTKNIVWKNFYFWNNNKQENRVG